MFYRLLDIHKPCTYWSKFFLLKWIFYEGYSIFTKTISPYL